MPDLQYYIAAFSSLHTAKVKGHKAPHKAVLLLAVIDLIEEDVILTPYIDLSDGLIEKFGEVWRRYIGKSDIFTLDICKPYFHLQYESFWRLVGTDEVGKDLPAKTQKELPAGRYSVRAMRDAFAYAEMDGRLFQLLRSGDARAKLRVALIGTYMTGL